MRPALERVLNRTSSLKLLRILVRKPSSHLGWNLNCSRCTRFPCERSGINTISGYFTSQSLGGDDDEQSSGIHTEHINADHTHQFISESKPAQKSQHEGQVSVLPITERATKCDAKASDKTGVAGKPALIVHERTSPHLIDNTSAGFEEEDGFLRTSNAASNFLRNIESRKLQIPVVGPVANQLWTSLLSAGFEEDSLLLDTVEYADRLYERAGLRWSKLYKTVILYLLRNGRGTAAVWWHDRLQKFHVPSRFDFKKVCRLVIKEQGDLVALEKIYMRFEGRPPLYGKVMPIFLKGKDYETALRWHHMLVSNGDMPSDLSKMEPILEYMSHSDPLTLERLIQTFPPPNLPVYQESIAEGCDRFSAREKKRKLNSDTEDTLHSGKENESRNRVTTGRIISNPLIKSKDSPTRVYNDTLGARWFATKWIPLSVASSAANALGFRQIGPLSLQSIALRDDDPRSVTEKIRELKDYGLSVTDSRFTRAVRYFADTGENALLRDLLQSDQHPDALEDRQLQESLLVYYAERGDWAQYRRTMVILTFGKDRRATERENIIFRTHLAKRQFPSAIRCMKTMLIKNIPISPESIFRFARITLRRRRQGRKPMWLRQDSIDLNILISGMTALLQSGYHVPPMVWREILRRLGMRGRLDELDRLCLLLASRYRTQTGSDWVPGERITPILRRSSLAERFGEPFQLLFPPSMQCSLVNWGFIHTVYRLPQQLLKMSNSATDDCIRQLPQRLTRGIRILHYLKSHGVCIDEAAVKRCVFQRLVALYGPGSSKMAHNRLAKERNPLSLEDLLPYIDEAWGNKLFDNAIELEGLIWRVGKGRSIRSERKRQRRAQARRMQAYESEHFV